MGSTQSNNVSMQISGISGTVSGNLSNNISGNNLSNNQPLAYKPSQLPAQP